MPIERPQQYRFHQGDRVLPFAASEPQADEAAPDDTAAVPASPANAQTPVWVWGVGAAVLAVAVWFLSR